MFGNKTRMPILTASILLEVLATAITQEKERKGIQNGGGKLSLFADDVIFYIENPIAATYKPLELGNKFSKVAEFKISIQKFVAFLYTNNELSEIESKKNLV